jgi:predicted metal-dependent peptidase
MTLDEMVDKLLDEHLSGGRDDDEKDGKGKGKRPNMEGMSEEEKQKLRDEIKSQLMAAAQNCAGNIPKGMGRIIEGLSSPKMNWREILRNQIQSTIRSDYSFLSPSKKGMSTPFKLPGMKRDETLDICVGIDASGSINEDDLKAFLSEIYGIMSQYSDYQIHVWSYDTVVYNPEIFRADEGRDISTYEVKGGGGTDFNASYEYMKDNSIDAKLYINFTDLYPGNGFGDPTYCDTIFVVRGNNKDTAPFGLTIRMD